MSKMIQLRNVPDDLHRVLKMRAASAKMSLSDYLLEEIRAVASRPTISEVVERIRRRDAVRTRIDSVAAVRAEREGRK